MPGMEAAVRAKKTSLEGMSFVREDGRSYGTIWPTGDADQQSLVSEYEILRGDLAKILVDLTNDNDNIKYVFGEYIVSMHQSEEEDGPITVKFANGMPTSDFDLVAACDGATSRTRAIGLNCGIRDYIISTRFWAAYFSIDEDLLGGGKVSQGYSAVGGRFMSLKPDPTGVTQVLLMSAYPRKDRDAMLPFHEASKMGDEAIKDFVARRYRGGGWRFDEVMDRMMESNDFYASEMVQVKLPNLYKGRFVTVGDAGCAPGPTGGGTSLAIAGAYVLAGEIAESKDNLPAALQAYEDRMRPIIDELQVIPPVFPGAVAPQTAWGIWLRNNIFAFIAWTRMLEFVQRFFGGAFGNNDKHQLPDYEWIK
jgi:2-polyprenyl-6-methoxyphenol hydroxylase-like FAD-dependent oxidoreductase